MHSLAHTMTRQAWACLREPQEQRLSVSLLKQLTTSVKDDFNNLCEIRKKTAPAKGENSKFVLPSKYKWARKEEMLAAGNVQPKCKQTTLPRVAGALTSYTPYNR